jgi:hypothetical protein
MLGAVVVVTQTAQVELRDVAAQVVVEQAA